MLKSQISLRLKKFLIILLTFLVGCVIMGIVVKGCNISLDYIEKVELPIKIDLNYYKNSEK